MQKLFVALASLPMIIACPGIQILAMQVIHMLAVVFELGKELLDRTNVMYVLTTHKSNKCVILINLFSYVSENQPALTGKRLYLLNPPPSSKNTTRLMTYRTTRWIVLQKGTVSLTGV
jgi:hypothetical protein